MNLNENIKNEVRSKMKKSDVALIKKLMFCFAASFLLFITFVVFLFVTNGFLWAIPLVSSLIALFIGIKFSKRLFDELSSRGVDFIKIWESTKNSEN